MRRTLTLLFFVLGSNFSFGQMDTVFITYDKGAPDSLFYSTDTLLFDTFLQRNVLHGTDVMPWTANQQYAKGYGLYLSDVEINPCRQGERPPEMEEIISIDESDTSLVIQLNIVGNCCHDFLCDVEVIGDSVINLIQYGYGNTYCACNCCFGLTYVFDLETEYSDFSSLKFVMIDGDRRTLRKL